MGNATRESAQSIAGEPGLLWKIWTENEAEKQPGGIYLFRDRASASAYIAKHPARLFDFNPGLTRVTRGPEE